MNEFFLAKGICKRCSKCKKLVDRWDYQESLSNLVGNVITEAREQVDEWTIKYDRLKYILQLADKIRFKCSSCSSKGGKAEAWKLIRAELKLYNNLLKKPKKESVDKTKKEGEKFVMFDFRANQKKEDVK